jgi:hypothetical protein
MMDADDGCEERRQSNVSERAELRARFLHPFANVFDVEPD